MCLHSPLRIAIFLEFGLLFQSYSVLCLSIVVMSHFAPANLKLKLKQGGVEQAKVWILASRLLALDQRSATYGSVITEINMHGSFRNETRLLLKVYWRDARSL